MPYKVEIPKNLHELTDKQLRDWYEQESWANQRAYQEEAREAIRDLRTRMERRAGRNEGKLGDALFAEVKRRERERRPDELRSELNDINATIDRVQETIKRRRSTELDVDDQECRLERLEAERVDVLRELHRLERRVGA